MSSRSRLSGSIGNCIVCVWLFQCAYCVGTRKGQWVIGTGQMWVMWMTLSTRSSGIELCSVSEVSQSSGAGLLLTPQLELFLCSHAWILVLHHYVFLVRIPYPPVSVCPLCLSQPRSSLLRRCFSTIMSSGEGTRLLRWSWAASWAERPAGGWMHMQIKLET